MDISREILFRDHNGAAMRRRRKWQPTPIFLPGKSPGQRSLVGYNPWGHKESDMTEHACMRMKYTELTSGPGTW